MSEDKLLDRLLTAAHSQAHSILVNKMPDARLMPAFVIVDGKGQWRIVGTPWENDTQKQEMLGQLRQYMNQNNAIAYSFVAEAWTAVQPESWTPDQPIGTRPSERPDRKEIVIALASDASETKVRIWHIVRGEDNRITALDEQDANSGDYAGTLADLLH